jgi:hypothetical protein
MDMNGNDNEVSRQSASGLQSPAPDRSATTIVIIFNSVAAGLGGLYAGTHSTALTALAAALVAVLAFFAVRRRTV